MKIENYSFGKMTINGKSYNNDLIVFPDKIESNWWREEGHSLSLEDLDSVLQYNPDYLIVGCGEQGQMDVPSKTKAELKKRNIDIVSGKTAAMCVLFNRYMEADEKAVGAFHLTC